LANNDFLLHEVDIKLYVLRSFVMHWIGAHVASGDIVAEHDCCLVQGTVELVEQLSDLGAFGHSIGNPSIFGFDA
jgi:hypothetical protein